MAKQAKRRVRVRVTPSEAASVNTSGGVVRISQPQTRTKSTARQKAAVVVDVVTPNAVGGFIGFLREHAVVGLAVGLVIGTQLKAIVDSLNANFISPLFGLFFGGVELAKKTSTIHWHGRHADVGWGAVVFQIIDFVFVMAVVYALIKFFKLDKLDQPKDKK